MEFAKRVVAGCFSLALILSLTACSGGGGDGLPPERPAPDSDSTQGSATQVSGYVVDDAVVGATINVYAFDEGRKGDLLASGKSGSDGAYAIDLKAAEGLLLIESRGGVYHELLSGTDVTVKSDERLQAIVMYRPGQPLRTMVTPFTYLVAALAQHRMATGQAPRSAYASAAADVNHLFDLDVAAVYPRSIADVGSHSGLNDEHVYGFYLAAYSAWSAGVDEQNGVAPHSVYTSLSAWQLIYQDLLDDGLLDGQVLRDQRAAEIALGGVALKSDVYRLDFVRHVLATTMHHANATNISLGDMLPLMLAFLERSSSFLPAAGAGSDIEIHTIEPEGLFHNGQFDYAVMISNPQLLAKVSFELNGEPLGTAANSLLPMINIDSTAYADGDYVIKVVAEDLLGNIISDEFTIRFDNTKPFVNVLSPAITNQTSHTLMGSYGDNGAGVRFIRSGGQLATLNRNNNSWQLPVTLSPGQNTVELQIEDWVGNIFNSETQVDLDRGLPVFDFSNAHGAARVSDGLGGFTVQTLAHDNPQPLYLPAESLAQDGLAIDRTDLANAQVPYFAFSANDPKVSGVGSDAGKLSAKMRYEKNGTAAGDWRVLSKVGDEFLIPLLTESLHPSWLQASPSDQHQLRVHVFDDAGNSREQVFGFRSDFIAPNIATGGPRLDYAVSNIADLTFEARANLLQGAEIDIYGYDLNNTSDHAVYIQAADPGNHLVERVAERKVREHLARLKTEVEWDVLWATNPVNYCTNGEVQPVLWNRPNPVPDVVYNYDGSTWQPMVRPAAQLGEYHTVMSDVPDAGVPGVWENVPDPDAEFKYVSWTSGAGTVTSYRYDYVAAIPFDEENPWPAQVLDRRTVYSDGSGWGCAAVRHFHQRTVQSYESQEGYPRTIENIVEDSETLSVENYRVFDETAQAWLTAFNGWYRVPAGHTVRLIKVLTGPSFAAYDDVEVASPTFASYTQKTYDSELVWTLHSGLELTIVHDAGVDNIFSMTPTTHTFSNQQSVYVLQR